jgi:hypothetical protein
MRNSFMNKRVTVNSEELLLRESNGHASVACNSIGKHLVRIRLSTTSSEANVPTLLYKALNALEKHDLVLPKLHVEVQPVVKNTISVVSVTTHNLYYMRKYTSITWC